MVTIITTAFENCENSLSVDELILRAKMLMSDEQGTRWGNSETEHATRAFYRDYCWAIDENAWLDAARRIVSEHLEAKRQCDASHTLQTQSDD